MNAQRFSDEDLTAFLDGEADGALNAAITHALETDAALSSRLASLDIPVAALRESYESLLADAPPMPTLEAAPEPRKIWPIGLGTFAAGLAAGVAFALFLPTQTPDAPLDLTWKQAVASYQSLYTTATLDGLAPSPDEAQAQLAAVSDTLGLNMRDLPVPAGLSFRRAQVLTFKGNPLIQVAYIRPDGTPVALCVLKSEKGQPGPMAQATLFGQTSLSWNAGGFAYLLIGGDDPAQLAPEAQPFERWSHSAT